MRRFRELEEYYLGSGDELMVWMDDSGRFGAAVTTETGERVIPEHPVGRGRTIGLAVRDLELQVRAIHAWLRAKNEEGGCS